MKTRSSLPRSVVFWGGTGQAIVNRPILEAQGGRLAVSVDHEDVIEDGVEISPGAVLCGNVTIGTGAWVCAGATVAPRVRIGADAVVGAGSVVLRDVPAGARVAGVPCKPIAKRTS